jgi:hypothetical protein
MSCRSDPIYLLLESTLDDGGLWRAPELARNVQAISRRGWEVGRMKECNYSHRQRHEHEHEHEVSWALRNQGRVGGGGGRTGCTV